MWLNVADISAALRDLKMQQQVSAHEIRREICELRTQVHKQMAEIQDEMAARDRASVRERHMLMVCVALRCHHSDLQCRLNQLLDHLSSPAVGGQLSERRCTAVATGTPRPLGVNRAELKALIDAGQTKDVSRLADKMRQRVGMLQHCPQRYIGC